jgi:hypothetical protein
LGRYFFIKSQHDAIYKNPCKTLDNFIDTGITAVYSIGARLQFRPIDFFAAGV